MNPKSNRSFLIISIIVAVLGFFTTTARADEHGKCVASTTLAKKATKKAPAEPTTKPSKQTVTAYADPRQPITVDQKGVVTFHDEMAPIMNAVDLSTVPTDAAIVSKREASVKGHVVMRLLAFTPTGTDE
jgi:hypothetical protein